MGSRLTDLYRKLKYRVVSIEGIRYDEASIPPGFSPFFFQHGRPEHKLTYGSGMIIHPKGFILTCYHVVAGLSTITVKCGKNAQLYQGKLVLSWPDEDVAILKIRPTSPISPVTFCTETRIGEKVFAVGNPFGFEHTLTMGVLSGKGRTVSTANSKYVDMLQTDCTLNPGNSGGPLFNSKGQVIGMNAVIIQSHQSMGFAIPASRFLSLIKKYYLDQNMVQ
jgi:S1-C subfamily serine protease